MFVQLAGSERLLNLAMVREIKIVSEKKADGFRVVAVDLLGKGKTIRFCQDYHTAFDVCNNIRHKLEDRGLVVNV